MNIKSANAVFVRRVGLEIVTWELADDGTRVTHPKRFPHGILQHNYNIIVPLLLYIYCMLY